MNKLIPSVIKNRLSVLILCIIIVVVGLYSYYFIPKQENPNTTVAVASITTVYPGASPQEVEQQVINVLEKYISELVGVDYYTSQSISNAGVIVVMYEMTYSMDDVEDELRQAVEDAQKELPEHAIESVVDTDLVSDNQFIISLSGEGYTGEEIAGYAQTVRDNIIDVEGLEKIDIDGTPENRVAIEVKPEQMENAGVSLDAVMQILQAYNLSLPSGGIDTDNGIINVDTPPIYQSLEDIEGVIVGSDPETFEPIYLEDVSEIKIEQVEEFYFSQDGETAILLTGRIEDGENAVLVGNELRKAIDDSKSLVPDDITFHEVMYAPADIENSINDFISNLLQSILLIVIVVMIGVHLRNGIIVSIALPLSILITFTVMNLLKMEFHFITIAGLIVSLGILVDNAIVISEAIQHHLNLGKEKVKAISDAVGETAIPVLTSTLTTIVTFSIIYFVPGVVGQVAGAIPTVVITALIASYFIAMIVVPVFAYYFFKPEPEHKRDKKSLLSRLFQGMLNFGLKHRITTVIAAFVTLGIAAFLAMQLGMQFFPVADKPVVYINFEGDEVNLEASKEVSSQINELLDGEAVVENYTYAVGSDLPSFFLTVPSIASAPNIGQYMLQLNDEEIDLLGGVEATARYLQDKLDETIELAEVTVRSLEYSVPADAKIAFVVSGSDQEKIDEVSRQMVDALNQIDGTERVIHTTDSIRTAYHVETDDDLLEDAGLLKFDVIRQVNTALLDAEVGSYQHEGESLDIVLRTDIEDMRDLENLQISSSISPAMVSLDEVADIEERETVSMIEHYNSEYYSNVLSNVLPGYSSLSIESELNEIYMSEMDLEGVTITGKGEVNNMLDLILALIVSAGLAVMFIYLILILQFKNLKKPLIILASIPLSFIGCGFGLWIFSMDIQAMALLGLVSLFGIVVNNSILLIEVMDSKIKEGISVKETCRSAVKLRFRPIILSSTTTCIGLVPLIISGDPMTAPMASVLLFGLLFSTILTMVVVPTLYAIQAESAQRKQQKRIAKDKFKG